MLLSLPTDDSTVIAMTRRHSVHRLFHTDLDIWVLDYPKWAQAFRDAGHDCPGAPDRFDIEIVNEHSADAFLDALTPTELDAAELRDELVRRVDAKADWWDIACVLPRVYCDFDRRRIYSLTDINGLQVWRYLPDGWTGADRDFLNAREGLRRTPIVPDSARYWVVDGRNLSLEGS